MDTIKNTSWAFRKMTRHSSVLIVAGFVYIGIGASYYRELLSDERAEGLTIAFNLMGLKAWGIAFMAVGFTALFSSVWPRRSEKWGYAVLTAISAAWASAYILGLLVATVNSPVTNLTHAFIWFLVAYLWWAISGLLNPPRRRRHGSG